MASRRTTRLLGGLSALALLAGVAALRWRRNPSPCPYSQRGWLDLPRPIVTRSRLREVLDPRPGERILDVGPGTGYYAVPVSRWLEPDGTLHALDVQRPMLEGARERVRDRGGRLEPVHGDARALPYADGAFDGAYLVTVLGEVPDEERALRELRRVLRPGGRLVVGELLPDPHFVPAGTLRERAERAGFRFDERVGARIGYFARFRVPD